jgi:hypothetical protein
MIKNYLYKGTCTEVEWVSIFPKDRSVTFLSSTKEGEKVIVQETHSIQANHHYIRVKAAIGLIEPLAQAGDTYLALEGEFSDCIIKWSGDHWMPSKMPDGTKVLTEDLNIYVCDEGKWLKTDEEPDFIVYDKFFSFAAQKELGINIIEACELYLMSLDKFKKATRV